MQICEFITLQMYLRPNLLPNMCTPQRLTVALKTFSRVRMSDEISFNVGLHIFVSRFLILKLDGRALYGLVLVHKYILCGKQEGQHWTRGGHVNIPHSHVTFPNLFPIFPRYFQRRGVTRQVCNGKGNHIKFPTR